MLATLLVTLHAATPAEPPARREVCVVTVSRRGHSAGESVAEQIARTLRTRGLKVVESREASRKILENSGVDPQSCDGTRVCVRHLAQLLGPKAVVVGVDVARAGSGIATHLEALAADEGAPLAQLDFTADTRVFNNRFSQPAQRFGADVASALARLDVAAPAPAPVVEPEPLPAPPPVAKVEKKHSDRPTAVADADSGRPDPGFARWPGSDAPLDAPPMTESPVSLTATAPSHWPRWTLLGGTLVAALTTAGFTVAGFQERSTYQSLLRDYGGGHDNASTVPRSVLEQHASNANTDFIGALIALAVTVPLAIGTTWLFVADSR